MDISYEDGQFLVRAARRAVEGHLRDGRAPNNPELESRFSSPCGVFVTLSRGGALRGCIGHPMPEMPLSRALVSAAIDAATGDPRFPPVTAGELAGIRFEVTILGVPQELAGDRPGYPAQIRIGRDGLIVRRPPHAGLLLPQVPAEHGWDAEEFLGHACEKAGMERDCWKDPDVVVSRFGGTVFTEGSP